MATDTAGYVELVQPAAAMDRKGSEAVRRKTGWPKRRQAAVLAPALSLVPPAPVALVKPHTAPAVQASLLDIEAAPTPQPASKTVAATKSPSTTSFHRIAAGDEDDSPVMVRTAVKGGEAEFTDTYLNSLDALFSGVDVLREVKLAAQWCQYKPERRKTARGVRAFVTSWLSRTSQRREVTLAIVAAGNQRNGFGQGGSYSAAAQPLDDLDDLLPSPTAKQLLLLNRRDTH